MESKVFKIINENNIHIILEAKWSLITHRGVSNSLTFFDRWIIPDSSPEKCLKSVISAVDILGEHEKMHIDQVRFQILKPF